MFSTDQDMSDLVAWRRRLHRWPEVSREEARTAQDVCAYLAPTRPDETIVGLGGHGLCRCVSDGTEPGPTVMFRARARRAAHRGDFARPRTVGGFPARLISAAMMVTWRRWQRSRVGRPPTPQGAGAPC